MPPYNDEQFSPSAPVALVTLRVLENNNSLSDISMLIDSGADVTMLPSGYVRQLGVEANADEAYQLEGFDGSISVAKAVNLNLIWGRLTFRGRFLLIDQEWGILGRDVLNNIHLTLDGPLREWHVR